LKTTVFQTDNFWLFRILYAGFAGLNEFSKLSALSYSPKMFAMNICIQDAIEPNFSGVENNRKSDLL